MLSNIKSSYFSEIIFSYIYERKKLKLVKYNKSLQKNINISIINYKFYSGKYIIYETNNIGKEYIDMYQIELKDMSNEPETENEKHDNEINNDLNDKNNNLI